MKRISLITLIATLALPVSAFAQTATLNAGLGVSAGTDTSVHASAGTNVDANVNVNLEAKAKDRADQEIDRRIESLQDLSTKIGEKDRLSAEQKTSLLATLTTQINLLTTLKAKIAADTDVASLKADVQSITKAYRIYMLVLPQGRIAAVSDRVSAVSASMQTTAVKLKARIDADTSANSAALLTTYNDLEAKLADANAKAAAAVSVTANLKPDNGDTTVEASNKAALATARADMQAATADLKAARQDITTIIQGVKGVHAGAEATTSANVGAH